MCFIVVGITFTAFKANLLAIFSVYRAMNCTGDAVNGVTTNGENPIGVKHYFVNIRLAQRRQAQSGLR